MRPQPSTHLRYSGRTFSLHEISLIQRMLQQQPPPNRAQLSRLVCQALDWRKPDGGLKDMSCRVALLRMQDDGLLALPPPLNGNNNGRAYLRRSPQAEPGRPIIEPAGRLDLHLDLVASQPESHLWNEYIDRYHYLGYQPLPGAQLRYFARAEGQPVALLGFGAAAWTTAPRDSFVGWTPEQRKARLHLVANNARFLILPWVTSRNLASMLLAKAAKRLPDDWQNRYGYRPVLLETFIEKQRFRGTCYQAANWTLLGETTGRGKLGDHSARGPVKTVWILPLAPDFRAQLAG